MFVLCLAGINYAKLSRVSWVPIKMPKMLLHDMLMPQASSPFE